MVSIKNSTTNIPNHTFCPYNPNRSIVMRITNMVTSLMKDSFKINDLAPFNVLYDVQHGTPETFKTKREIYIPAVDIYWAQIIFQYSHELCHLLIEELAFVFSGSSRLSSKNTELHFRLISW